MKTNEIKAYTVSVCRQIVEKLAEQENTASTELKVRIDLKNRFSKPVFALFNSSGLIRKISLSEIVSAGGGKELGLGLMLSLTVRELIKDIYLASIKRFQQPDFQSLFLLLVVKNDKEENTPFLSIYASGKLVDSLPISEIVAVQK